MDYLENKEIIVAMISALAAILSPILVYISSVIADKQEKKNLIIIRLKWKKPSLKNRHQVRTQGML